MPSHETGYYTQFMFPFGVADRGQLTALMETVTAMKYLKPSHIGLDERKRKKYSPEELDAALEQLSARKRGSLFLWHVGGGRDADSLSLSNGPPSQLEMCFYGEKLLAHGAVVFQEFEAVVAQFPPCLAKFAVITEGPEDDELKAYLKSIDVPSNPTQIYFCGVGAFRDATYLDAEIGERLEPALRELGAERLPSGGWRLLAKDKPWTSSAIEAAEWIRTTGTTLRKHGLQGRADSITGKFHPAPNWRRPESWTGIDLRMERKLSTPNE